MMTFAACAALALACDKSEPMAPTVPAPIVRPMPGMAIVDGHTLDLQGKAIVGATVTVTETGVQATSDGDGHWQLTVGGSTTINLRAAAADYATTIGLPMIVTTDNAALGVDFLLVPKAKIDELNKLANKGSDAAGVVAVQVRSLSGACSPDGGTLALNPAGLCMVVYASAGAMEDASLTDVQKDSAVAAWIAGMTPPAAYSTLLFQKSGCTQMPLPVQDGAVTYMGMVHVEAGALSQVTVFVE